MSLGSTLPIAEDNDGPAAVSTSFESESQGVNENELEIKGESENVDQNETKNLGEESGERNEEQIVVDVKPEQQAVIQNPPPQGFPPPQRFFPFPFPTPGPPGRFFPFPPFRPNFSPFPPYPPQFNPNNPNIPNTPQFNPSNPNILNRPMPFQFPYPSPNGFNAFMRPGMFPLPQLQPKIRPSLTPKKYPPGTPRSALVERLCRNRECLELIPPGSNNNKRFCKKSCLYRHNNLKKEHMKNSVDRQLVSLRARLETFVEQAEAEHRQEQEIKNDFEKLRIELKEVADRHMNS